LKKGSNSSNPFEEVMQDLRPLFKSFERYLIGQASHFVPEIRKAATEVIAPKGKYIRPMLVFSSAVSDADKTDIIRRATIVELTHLSTLVHDDVIDNASMRRNCITPNSKYGARTAILLGDVIFSHMMLLAFEDANSDVAKQTAKCIRTICEGEIRQTLSDKAEIVSRKKYYEIVYGKTAALFELSCLLGAMSGSADEKWIKSASEVGKQLGIAYQIYDDICDWFMSEADAGKTLGTDLISGKQTYPLILLIEKLSKSKVKSFVKNLPTSDFNSIRNMMLEYGVLDECSKEYFRRISLAEKALKPFDKHNANLLKCCKVMRSLNVNF